MSGLVKGALVAVDPANRLPSVIVFQYNPSSLTRELQARAATGDDGARSEAMRLYGAPVENITMELELDATDQLDQSNGVASELGIYPQLSALELLVYPKSTLVIANALRAATGSIELIGPTAPFTLLIWGLKRVLPVRLSALNITEEAFDSNLSPIRARVQVSLRVLSYSDLQLSDPGYTLFLINQVAREALAHT
ncbi:MAG TPA: hypothetical protein VGJ60_09995 [Chloroflexota bacterium]|jgi:hypothetical protein